MRPETERPTVSIVFVALLSIALAINIQTLQDVGIAVQSAGLVSNVMVVLIWLRDRSRSSW